MPKQEPSVIPNQLLAYKKPIVNQIVGMYFDLFQEFNLPLETHDAFWAEVWKDVQSSRQWIYNALLKEDTKVINSALDKE